MNKSEKWDNAAAHFQNVYAEGQNEYNKMLLAFLEETEMLRPSDRVIDIGCGVGKYGRSFAMRGCDVTLSDISEKMLEFAAQNMAEFDTPWRTIRCDFAEVDPRELTEGGKYTLAISTFCPAICDVNTVKKLSEITDGWCFLARFSQWEQPERDELFNAMGLSPKSPHGEGKDDCANVIQSISRAGYVPQVKYVDYCWSDDRTVDEMVSYITDRYYEPGEVTEEFRRRLSIAVAALSKDGIFTDSVNTKVAWIYWKT